MRRLKYVLLIIGILIIDALVFEPYSLNVTTYNLENQQLSGIKIVFATDFHIAPYPWEKMRLQKIINRINEQNADLVILGGDYVNRHDKKSTMSPDEIATKLKGIIAPKVAVLGNHDAYYGKSEVKTALKNVGISVLDNQNVSLILRRRHVSIAGVADYNTGKPRVEEVLKNLSKPIIFITHSPDVFPNILGRVDIAFAGHTHGGQIVIPLLGALLVPTDSGRKYVYGLMYENGKPLVISSGLGTSILPLRFYNRPEIVVVKFR